MDSGSVSVYLAGPTRCELVDEADESSIRARLGPDPLRAPKAIDEFTANLARRRVQIGVALLNQAIIAGVGNVYRAEILFLTGIHPGTTVATLSQDDVRALWETAASELRAGERLGRIVTVEPVEVGMLDRKSIPRGERLYVYKRAGEPCRRCGSVIESTKLGARTVWFCASCQKERA